MNGRVSTIAAWALLAAIAVGTPWSSLGPKDFGAARADDHADGGSDRTEGHGPGSAGRGGNHQSGSDGSSHSGGQAADHGNSAGGRHSTDAGNPDTATGSGNGGGNGGAGKDRADRPGGRPPWAKEGIPEIELGRLNVARSPDRVLNRAYTEALASLTEGNVRFYNQSLDDMIADLSLNWDNVTFIDSPLQNLALLRDALDGDSALRSVGVRTPTQTLMAVFLGTASDKTIPITPDTALAVSTILDRPLSPEDAASLAADAERIRIAILAGHG